MKRPYIDDILNFDDPREKETFLRRAGVLQGLYVVEIEPTNGRHRDPQRRYFHAVVIRSLYDYLNDHAHGDSGHYTKEQCKDFIVAKVCGTTDLIHPLTGEVVEAGATRPSTAGFTVEQYTMLIDGARKWLRDTFGIITPDPNPNWRMNREVANV
jgi:hypothetical protein